MEGLDLSLLEQKRLHLIIIFINNMWSEVFLSFLGRHLIGIMPEWFVLGEFSASKFEGNSTFLANSSNINYSFCN